MMAALSTQSESTLRAALSKARWADVKNELEQLGNIMNEGNTNRSVALPDADLKQTVDQKFQNIQRLVENKRHNEAFAQVNTLKGLVKDTLYHRQQHAAFSSMPAQSYEEFEHQMQWSDVKGEVDQIHQMMHEGTTNRAVNSPDVQMEILVEQTLEEIKAMVAQHPEQHGLVMARIHALKGLVKDKLYNGLPPQEHVPMGRWTDVEDEMKEIKLLMQEHRTNFAVRLPDQKLSDIVDQELAAVESVLNGEQPDPAQHAEAYNRVHNLKGRVKKALY